MNLTPTSRVSPTQTHFLLFNGFFPPLPFPFHNAPFSFSNFRCGNRITFFNSSPVFFLFLAIVTAVGLPHICNSSSVTPSFSVKPRTFSVCVSLAFSPFLLFIFHSFFFLCRCFFFPPPTTRLPPQIDQTTTHSQEWEGESAQRESPCSRLKIFFQARW